MLPVQRSEGDRFIQEGEIKVSRFICKVCGGGGAVYWSPIAGRDEEVCGPCAQWIFNVREELNERKPAS